MKKIPLVEDIIAQVREALINAGAVSEETEEVTEVLLTLAKWAFQHGVECGKMLRDSELSEEAMNFIRETIN